MRVYAALRPASIRHGLSYARDTGVADHLRAKVAFRNPQIRNR
jgi:hypothetical protein